MWEADRPDGVVQPSPGAALHVGQLRPSQPRAMWRRGRGVDRAARARGPHRQSQQRAPTAAPHVGQDSSSQARRLLTLTPSQPQEAVQV